MARVTVEDCVLLIPNRFELVMLAAQRARDVSAGAELTVDRDRDKNPVVALREIAEETLSLDGLNESRIKGQQKHVEAETIEAVEEGRFELESFTPELEIQPVAVEGHVSVGRHAIVAVAVGLIVSGSADCWNRVLYI